MAELPSDFADLLIELLEAEVQFLLVGGYAVAHYGHLRATKDLDVWICPGPDNADRVIRALRRFGAPLSSLGRSARIDRRRRRPLIKPALATARSARRDQPRPAACRSSALHSPAARHKTRRRRSRGRDAAAAMLAARARGPRTAPARRPRRSACRSDRRARPG